MSVSYMSDTDLKMDDLQAFLPLREPTFYILLSLSPAPKHGYAILKNVEELSGCSVVLGTGTLYGAIKRLLEREWIHRVDEAIPGGTEHERKAYALTELGRRILNAEIARLKKLVAVALTQTVEESS
jgi:DNA-binding PadR family transcriptional regulator